MRLGSIAVSVLLAVSAFAAPPVSAEPAARAVVVEGRAVDRHGDPLAGASVLAIDVAHLKPVRIATAGADGRFQGTVSLEGGFFLEVCEGGRGPVGCAGQPSTLPVYLGPQQQVDTPLRLESSFAESDAHVDVGTVALRRRAARLTVTVDPGVRTSVSLQGATSPNKGIVPANRPGARLAGRETERTRRIGGLAPGRYVVFFSYWKHDLGESSYPVRLRPGANHLDLSGPGPSVSGTVTRDGVPVTGRSVTLQTVSMPPPWYGDALHVDLDERGHYRFPRVGKGTYRVLVGGLGKAAPYTVATVRVPGPRSRVTADLAIDGTSRGRIAGTAPAADGQTPAQRAAQVVKVRDLSSEPGLPQVVGRVPVDPDTGEFVVDRLPPGRYGLETTWAPEQPSWTTVTVRAGRSADATLVAPRIGSGRLTLDLPEGADVVDLELDRPDWAPSTFEYGEQEATDGKLVLDDLPYGTYEAVLEPYGAEYVGMPQEVTFDHDDAEVALDEGVRAAAIDGVLTLPDSGKPAPWPGIIQLVFCQRLGGSTDYWLDLRPFDVYSGSTFGAAELRPGTWVCRAELPDRGHGTWQLPYYYPQSEPIEIGPGETAHLELPLETRSP